METYSYSTYRGVVDGVHFAQLRLPPAAPNAAGDAPPCAVVVHLHGGFWKQQWGVHNLETGALFAAFGGAVDDVATWNVEYARVDQLDPATSAAGGGWPTTCLDALAALNALTTLPAHLRSRLDLTRVYLCGHSAGAYLALWLGCLSRLSAAQREQVAIQVDAVLGSGGPEAGAVARAGVDPAIHVRGVVSLAGVTSLAACAAAGLSDFHDAAQNFLWRAGGSVASAIESGQLGAACPLSLWSTMLAAPAEESTMTSTPPEAASSSRDGGGGGAGCDGSRSGDGVSGDGGWRGQGSRGPTSLRVLLVHGLADTDVPASLSVALAAAVWSTPSGGSRPAAG